MDSQIRFSLRPKTAGRLMNENIPVIHPAATIAEVERLLLTNASKLETINYIYVINAEHHMVGVLSVKEVFRAPKSKPVSELMRHDPISVELKTPAITIAMLALNHRLKEIPVLDPDKRLVGVVTYDAILKILHNEHVASALRGAGIDEFTSESETILTASIFSLFKKRIPWLIVGLAGSAIAAFVIGSFESVLQSQIILASFIPVITYLSGAVGMQSETLFIRTAAMDRNFKFKTYLLKDILTGITIAFVLSTTMGLATLAFWDTPWISLVLTLSIFIATQLSMAVAIILPWAFSKFRVDPAVVGGPLDTIISDILSITVYFTFANIILQWLGQ